MGLSVLRGSGGEQGDDSGSSLFSPIVSGKP